MNLTKTQIACLEWLADKTQEYGMPGGKRTMQALVDRGLAHKVDGRWTITDIGLIELGPIALVPEGGAFKRV